MHVVVRVRVANAAIASWPVGSWHTLAQVPTGQLSPAFLQGLVLTLEGLGYASCSAVRIVVVSLVAHRSTSTRCSGSVDIQYAHAQRNDPAVGSSATTQCTQG